MKIKNNKGFSHVELLLMIFVLVVISAVGYMVIKRQTSTVHAGSWPVISIASNNRTAVTLANMKTASGAIANPPGLPYCPNKPVLRVSSVDHGACGIRLKVELNFIQGAGLDYYPMSNAHGYIAYHYDGVYDSQTAVTVKQFQQAHGLTTDGVVGAGTWAKIESVAEQSKLAYTVQACRVPNSGGVVKVQTAYNITSKVTPLLNASYLNEYPNNNYSNRTVVAKTINLSYSRTQSLSGVVTKKYISVVSILFQTPIVANQQQYGSGPADGSGGSALVAVSSLSPC